MRRNMSRISATAKTLAAPLHPFAWYLLVSMSVMSGARLALALWQSERVTATDGWLLIFLQGVRFDLVLQGTLLALPLSLTPLLASFTPLRHAWRHTLPILLTAFTLLIVFMELTTPSFILEYDLRPNILFVKYLEYPREVFSMLWTGYKLPIAMAVVILPATGFVANKLYSRSASQMPATHPTAAILVMPLLLLLCAIASRSSLDHRPVNPSDAVFSNDPLVNMLPLSSAYSMLYGVYEMRHEGAGIKYGEIAPDRVIANMRRMTGQQPSAFRSQVIPTLRRQGKVAPRPKNLVILLEESFGARFVGALGGLPLTPQLDRLSLEGIWFTNMYATGTRSIRGIEAVTTGFLPTVTESVVKLGGAQRGFFTIAALLEAHGYDTSFIYGGSAQFDNMRRFFANNGFNTIIDEADYESPGFIGSWGVSDEDLVKKANAYFESLPDDKPFFSLVFTSSNHAPFEYPDGRITPYNQPAATRENAIQYADYAIGRFIEAARRSDYWNDTIFLIVADHDSRVKGAELVPIQHFHIPALILGEGVEPRVIDRLASQVDLIPTLVPMLGIEAEHPATGLNLLGDEIEAVPPHAVMQYGNNIAYREGDEVLIFQPEHLPRQFIYRGQHLEPVDGVDEELYEMALSHTEWPRLAYANGWYRLPARVDVPDAPEKNATGGDRGLVSARR